jgi:hypothetical protein
VRTYSVLFPLLTNISPFAGQGIKACPHSDTLALAGPLHSHTSATREDVERHLAAARNARLQFTSPQRDTFLKTVAYIGAVRRLGCRRPRQQHTVRTGEELQYYELEQNQYEHFRRGYSAPPTCEGRILYHEYPDPDHKDAAPRVYLRCSASRYVFPHVDPTPQLRALFSPYA